jgi:hypothetical protein
VALKDQAIEGLYMDLYSGKQEVVNNKYSGFIDLK